MLGLRGVDGGANPPQCLLTVVFVAKTFGLPVFAAPASATQVRESILGKCSEVVPVDVVPAGTDETPLHQLCGLIVPLMAPCPGGRLRVDHIEGDSPHHLAVLTAHFLRHHNEWRGLGVLILIFPPIVEEHWPAKSRHVFLVVNVVGSTVPEVDFIEALSVFQPLLHLLGDEGDVLYGLERLSSEGADAGFPVGNYEEFCLLEVHRDSPDCEDIEGQSASDKEDGGFFHPLD